MRALVFDRFGGPEVLQLRERPDPVPTAQQALVRTRAIGLNFADVYRRQGHYHLAGDPPWIAGYEASGEVVSAPADSGFAPGDRVAFADNAYANAALAVLRTAGDRRTRSAELFDAVRSGKLKVNIDARYPLAEGAAAHAHLESRRTLGKVLLIPGG